MRSDRYQIALIILGVAATAFFGVFFYREIFPEYRIYQDDYVALEKFRSTYTGEPPPAFQAGVKQIVFEREDKGQPVIDRCTSCHVALQVPYFSPTKISRDSNGNIVRDDSGIPVLVSNEDYIWDKLDKKIAELTDEKKLQQLRENGESSKAEAGLAYAKELKSLKMAQVGGHAYDVEKVLAMHPLIGKETRPFEYHALDEYGCTSCHGGNGRGLTTDKAHGPVFDEEYETEYMGPKPEFLERDKANDPLFARVFNDKPGDALLFQTTPILVGHLMQAKCIQCHDSKWMAVNLEKSFLKPVEDTQAVLADAAGNEKVVASTASDVDWLTKDYHRGEQLYISQACYACHRIAGMSRGGVGPELTRAGGLYPWYLKEKLSWPQGSLSTSTMPNMHLDHAEIEDLMSFLLGQNGPTKAVSEIDYKIGVQRWEAGRKMSWEKPVPPSEIHNLRSSMTVFATQGCAACHRLKGFQSDVGYSIEKDGHSDPDFGSLYQQQQWFRKLFPEFLKGSELVRILEENAQAIDQRIVDNVRKGSLLEEIEAQYPQSIESLYSEFRYADRARDSSYGELAADASTSEQKEGVLKQLRAWKFRVHRVLMMYVQEYGLGRVIGPRPNWSGVYRSDQWLMEHFHNPAAHVPKSIMPIFPFDDSKFYALTYMLDVLAKHNRDDDREVWQHEGFDPALAFQSHCSQCHGEYLQGNGPVAEWIYPIPKNLRNAEFLRNLTRENAIQSITHGVKGTPMPPWGETPKDKENYDGIPIFTREEIGTIADWIYSSVPGASSVKGTQEVPKWQYMPQNVVEELHNEGGELIPGQQEQPSDLFDVIPNPIPGEGKYVYYIKQKYYTENNIEAGKRFFESNCAVCHGADADGSGLRAGIMQEAKPRMLTNLDWLKSRDDLRLLRSIKYGVGGTAMTPWGDLTSEQQRLQLVIFIRSLSRDAEQRDQLVELHYIAFNASMDQVEMARIAEYASLVKIQDELDAIRLQQQSAFEKASGNAAASEQAVEFYKKQLRLASELKKHEKFDKLLVDLKKTIKKESDIYNDIGMDLNRAGIGETDWERFLKMLSLNEQRFMFKDGRLIFNNDAEKEKQITQLANQIAADLDAQITKLKQEEAATRGKILSEERTNALKEVNARMSTLAKVKKKLLSGIEEAGKLRKQEGDLFQRYVDQLDIDKI